MATTPRPSNTIDCGKPGQARPALQRLAPWGDPHMISVLLVEDDGAVRSVIGRSLQRRGCEVVSAGDGLEGLEFVRRRSFDAVISDVNMPGYGGLWFWERALVHRPELGGRFVLMSAQALPDQPSARRFLESEHFLLKPFLPAALWVEVLKIVGVAEEGRRESNVR